jgi:hypothetical protein
MAPNHLQSRTSHGDGPGIKIKEKKMKYKKAIDRNERLEAFWGVAVVLLMTMVFVGVGYVCM